MNLFNNFSARKCVGSVFVKYSMCVEEREKGEGLNEQKFTEVMKENIAFN